MTHKHYELPFIGQSWGQHPTAQAKGEGHFLYVMQINERWVMVLPCRLTTNQNLDESCVIKLKGEVGGACKQRQDELSRWRTVVTPDEPDVDFKLDGIGNSFVEGVGASIYHLLGIYLLLSHSTEPVQGEGLEALLISINVLWSTEQPALTCLSGTPWTHFSTVSEAALSQTSGLTPPSRAGLQHQESSLLYALFLFFFPQRKLIETEYTVSHQ